MSFFTDDDNAENQDSVGGENGANESGNDVTDRVDSPDGRNVAERYIYEDDVTPEKRAPAGVERHHFVRIGKKSAEAVDLRTADKYDGPENPQSELDSLANSKMRRVGRKHHFVRIGKRSKVTSRTDAA